MKQIWRVESSTGERDRFGDITFKGEVFLNYDSAVVKVNFLNRQKSQKIVTLTHDWIR